jgi:gamma-glutamyltranspeptidase/glutathione hydrolase
MSKHDWPIDTWTVTKPAVEGGGGLIASQHPAASDAGAAVLRAGGNAIDAAVTAGLLIGTVEPWMSGIGGGCQMLVWLAKEQKAYVVDGGMIAPAALDPADYPLAGGTGAELFNWPAVQDNRNIEGYHAIAVPGYVDAVALALERFGSIGWKAAIQPAIDQARAGMAVDWYATLKIASGAASLSKYPASREAYLVNGHTPVGEWGGPIPRITLGKLADTLERLSEAGPRDYYDGAIARALAADLAEGGSRLNLADLQGYKAEVREADSAAYRGATVFTAPGLTAGPSLQMALRLLAGKLQPGAAPDAAAFDAYAQCLMQSYAERLETMGDADESRAPSCTTHLSVVDKEGNFVALTQTLLSLFGSRVMLPQTGVTMNNGIMWFDPRPGRPNSIRAGRRPLSNMCPTFAIREDGLKVALGASGGRRIFPAVFQLLSFLVDYGMDLNDAAHQPRIDVSGTETVLADHRLGEAVIGNLAGKFSTEVVQNGVFPALFACPNLAARKPDGGFVGAAYIPSPWSKVSAA